MGEVALRNVEKMEQSAIDLVRQTQGVDRRLAGDVRVTTTDTIGLEFVMRAMRNLHDEHPDVRVLLNTSTQVENLAKREADIAIRTIKPDNPDLLMPARGMADGVVRVRGLSRAAWRADARHRLRRARPRVLPVDLNARNPLTVVGEPVRAGRIVSGLNSNLMSSGRARRARARRTPGADRGARRAGARGRRARRRGPMKSGWSRTRICGIPRG